MSPGGEGRSADDAVSDGGSSVEQLRELEKRFLQRSSRRWRRGGRLNGRPLSRQCSAIDGRSHRLRSCTLTEVAVWALASDVKEFRAEPFNFVSGRGRLGENSLTDEEALILADVIRGKMHLEQLWLNKNKFTVLGAEAIASALKDNTCLKCVV
ncbi:unnamed protein product [Lampetra fluviatilis]